MDNTTDQSQNSRNEHNDKEATISISEYETTQKVDNDVPIKSSTSADDLHLPIFKEPPDAWLLKLFCNPDGVFDDIMKQLGINDDESTTTLESHKNRNPNLLVPHCYFVLNTKKMPKKYCEAIEAILMKTIEENNMQRYYMKLCKSFGWIPNVELLRKMEQSQKALLRKYALERDDWRKNIANVTSIKQALMSKAELLSAAGDTKESLQILWDVYRDENDINRIKEILFHELRIAVFTKNYDLYEKALVRLREVYGKENKCFQLSQLMAYEAYFALMNCDLEKAGKLMFNIVYTFRSYELMAKEKVNFYAVILAMLHMDRNSLKQKILKSRQADCLTSEQPLLKAYVKTLIDCDYVNFLRCLKEVEARLKFDPVMSPYRKYYSAMMRLRAYNQILTAYGTIKIDYIADQFGVDAEFILKDFTFFIQFENMECKINSLTGTINVSEAYRKKLQKRTIEFDTRGVQERMDELYYRFMQN